MNLSSCGTGIDNKYRVLLSSRQDGAMRNIVYLANSLVGVKTTQCSYYLLLRSLGMLLSTPYFATVDIILVSTHTMALVHS